MRLILETLWHCLVMGILGAVASFLIYGGLSMFQRLLLTYKSK